VGGWGVFVFGVVSVFVVVVVVVVVM
jgi:hypothetical protein